MRQLNVLDCGFEFRWGHGGSSLVSAVHCVGSDLCNKTSWTAHSTSLITQKLTSYFRRLNNIMVYLLNFNITYIIILATCFDSYESSSGINFKNYCTYSFTVFCLTVFVLDKNCKTKNCKTICTIVLEINAWRWLIRVETCRQNNYMCYIEVK